MTNLEAIQITELKIAKVDAIRRNTNVNNAPGVDRYRLEYRKELMMTLNDLYRDLKQL